LGVIEKRQNTERGPRLADLKYWAVSIRSSMLQWTATAWPGEKKKLRKSRDRRETSVKSDSDITKRGGPKTHFTKKTGGLRGSTLLSGSYKKKKKMENTTFHQHLGP